MGRSSVYKFVSSIGQGDIRAERTQNRYHFFFLLPFILLP